MSIKLLTNLKSLTEDDTGRQVAFTILNLDGFLQTQKLPTDKKYWLEIKGYQDKRTLDQNRYLWALVGEIDKAMNGGRRDDPMKVYCDLLKEAGAKTYMIEAPLAAELDLRQNFRAVAYLGKSEKPGKGIYEVFVGSSKFDKQEMSLLIDTVLNRASELDIATEFYEEVFYGQ